MRYNPIFLLGLQRSGTNFAFSLIEHISNTSCFNEDNAEAFDNFSLRSPEVIQEIIDRHADRICVFKAISDSLSIEKLRRNFRNAGFVFLYREPAQWVDSFAHEFSQSNHLVNHIIQFDFFSDKLAFLTGQRQNVPRVEELLSHFERRFSSMQDQGNKIALYWLLVHVFILDSGVLRKDDPSLLLASYDEITHDAQGFTEDVAKMLLDGAAGVGELPPVQTRRLFFTEPVDDDLRELCDGVYAELDQLRVRSRARR